MRLPGRTRLRTDCRREFHHQPADDVPTHAELDVGAVNGNDIPGFRVDRLPYGGAKASGLGREGVRYAIEEMTERRVLTLKLD